MMPGDIFFERLVEMIEKGSWHVTDQYGSSAGLPKDVCQRIASDIAVNLIVPELQKRDSDLRNLQHRLENLLMDMSLKEHPS